MARAATNGELETLKTNNQYTRLYLAIHNPTTVYTARVNQTTFVEPIMQVTFDGGTGTLANVLTGMTMYIGSYAGGWDLGTVRIRKTPSATVFFVGENSDIAWANDLYLTVVDEFNLWQKNALLESEIDRIDFDIEYADQNTLFNPIPVLGSNMVLWLHGATVDFTPDAGQSYVLDSTITGYLWTCPNASASLNLNTATPLITYNAAGVYRVGCTVTAANGKTTTGYRYVFVYDREHPPVTQFQLKRCVGSKESGGWEFGVSLYGEAGLTTVKPNALVILFADDYYDGIKGSLGHFENYEHIICEGRFDGETIKYDFETGEVSFTVYTSQNILERMTGYSALFTEAETPAKWSEFVGLTIDKALFNLLYWRSTVIPNVDVFLSGDTRRMPEVDLPIDKIWKQMTEVSERRMIASACFDRYNRLFIEVDIQYLADAERSSIPVIMELEKDDWRGELNIEVALPSCAMVEVNGIRDDTPENDLHSRCPKTMKRLGTIDSYSELVFDHQEHANILSGMIFAKNNNPFPWLDISLASNNRMMDITPNQRLTISVSATDTPRGIEFTNKKIIPRRINFDFEETTGMLWSNIEAESETTGRAGVTFIVPPPALVGTEEIEFPDFEDYSWPSYESGEEYPEYIGLPLPTGNGECPIEAEANGPYSLHLSGEISTIGQICRTGYFRCIIRTAGHANRTTYVITGRFQKLKVGSLTEYEDTTDNDFYTVRAYNSTGTLIATGVNDPVVDKNVRTGVLNAIAAAEISKIVICLSDSQLLRPSTVYASFPEDAPTDAGVLTWGLQGAGIWVTHLNSFKSGSTIWTGAHKAFQAAITIGANNEFLNKPIRVKHRLFYRSEAVLDGGSGVFLETLEAGQTIGGFGAHVVGFGPIAINAYNNGGWLLDSGWAEWSRANTGGANNTANFYWKLVADIRGQNSFYKLEFVEHLLYAWLDSPYRILLSQAILWNVCPPEAL